MEELIVEAKTLVHDKPGSSCTNPSCCVVGFLKVRECLNKKQCALTICQNPLEAIFDRVIKRSVIFRCDRLGVWEWSDSE